MVDRPPRKPKRTATANSRATQLRREIEQVRREEKAHLETIIENVGLGDELFAPNTTQEAVRTLARLAKDLHRDGYRVPAAAIASYLLGDCASLEEAFRLYVRQKRGIKLSGHSKQLVRSTLHLRAEGVSWKSIADRLGKDASSLRRLCRDHAEAVHIEDVEADVLSRHKA